MKYQLSDDGIGIRLICNGGELFLLKASIVQITVMHDNILVIWTSDPMQAIYLKYADVFNPLVGSPLLLRDFIINWLTD